MATLTETSYYARKGINISIIVVTLIIVGRFAFLGALGLKDRFFPAPPPPANFALGELPIPNFEGGEATPSGVAYTLDTADGYLPKMPATVMVYSLVPNVRVSFGTFEKMKAQAGNIGFTGEPQKIQGSLYRFQDPNNILRTLEIDEISGDFEVKYEYGSDLGVFGQKNFTSKEVIIDKAQEYFSKLGLFTPDLATGSAVVSYMRLDSQNLIPTTSLSNADAVFVSFERSPINEIPIIYPNAKKGLVSALITGSSDPSKQVLQARYFHSSVDMENTGTYNPITTEEAFELLKAGKAGFSSLPDPLPKTVPIRTVSIGYLDPYPPQGFLQPVIVFSDEKEFKAFVPAVRR